MNKSVAFIGTRGIPARFGGFETFVDRVASSLGSAGMRCIVYSTEKAGPRRYMLRTGVEIRRIPQIGVANIDRVLRELIPILDQVVERRRIVHIMGGSLSVLLWRLIGAKTIVSLDGMEWKRLSYDRITKWTAKISYLVSIVFAEIVTADSNQVCKIVKEITGHEPIFLGYGPREYVVPSDQEIVEFLNGLDLKQNEYFLFVGRMVPEKGLHVLLEEFRHHPEKTLAVVGFDPFGGQYQNSLIRSAPRNVRFLGPLYGRDYELISVGAMAVVRPSLDDSEGLPPAAIEAMGFGRPVLASDVPQHRTAFDDAALYWDVGKTEELRLGLNRLASDEPLRESLGAKAHMRAETEFSWRRWISLIKGLYS